MGLHEKIASDLGGFGGLLRCTVCGREEALGEIAVNLREGWPKCHGYTMTWMTSRLLEKERAGAEKEEVT